MVMNWMWFGLVLVLHTRAVENLLFSPRRETASPNENSRGLPFASARVVAQARILAQARTVSSK